MISKLDSRLGALEHIKVVPYKEKEGLWTPQQSVLVIYKLRVTDDRSKNPKRTSVDQLIRTISSESHLFDIRINGRSWYKGQNNSGNTSSTTNSVSSTTPKTLSETWKERKVGSWIWVRDNDGQKITLQHDKWIFDNTLRPAGKDGQQGHAETYELQTCYIKEWCPKTTPISKVLQTNMQLWHNTIWNSINGATNNSQGKWLDTEEFCKVGYSRNLQDKELEDLKLFCSAKQN